MIKRLIDILLALLLILTLMPFMILAALIIWMAIGRPVLFTQLRPGYMGKPFMLYKFRTMTNQKDEAGHLLSDRERMTKAGLLIRRCSIDELPQLFNVLKGDLSLVGPRPLLMEYLDLYTSEQARRHDVRPGITGWAQINGRNATSWEERFDMDVWYVDNRSLWLDMKILCLTFFKVISAAGISQSGYVTMEKFRGSRVE